MTRTQLRARRKSARRKAARAATRIAARLLTGHTTLAAVLTASAAALAALPAHRRPPTAARSVARRYEIARRLRADYPAAVAYRRDRIGAWHILCTGSIGRGVDDTIADYRHARLMLVKAVRRAMYGY